MSDTLLTSREAADLLRYRNLKSFNRALHQFGIPHRYVGGRLSFDRARVLAWRQTFKPAKRGPKPKHTLVSAPPLTERRADPSQESTDAQAAPQTPDLPVHAEALR